MKRSWPRLFPMTILVGCLLCTAATARDAELERLEAAVLCQAQPYRCIADQPSSPTPAPRKHPKRDKPPTPARTAPAVAPVVEPPAPTVTVSATAAHRTTVASHPRQKEIDATVTACGVLSGMSAEGVVTRANLERFVVCTIPLQKSLGILK
jgi:hypothetical protein